MPNFEPFNRQKTCRYGQMLYNAHDPFVGRSLDLYGEYCEGEVELFRQLLKPGNVVVEVGANIGAHTVFLAQQVAPMGVVLAFEPQRILFQTLCANLALNHIHNVFCFQHAVGAEPSTVMMPPFDPRRAPGAPGPLPPAEQVPLCQLDHLAVPVVHFIKIDTGGSEQQVLAGARDLVERFRPVLYVANEHLEKAVELTRFIHGLSYQMYWHRPAYFNPHNFLGNTQNAFPGAVSRNLICIHKAQPRNLQGFEELVVHAQ